MVPAGISLLVKTISNVHLDLSLSVQCLIIYSLSYISLFHYILLRVVILFVSLKVRLPSPLCFGRFIRENEPAFLSHSLGNMFFHSSSPRVHVYLSL